MDTKDQAIFRNVLGESFFTTSDGNVFKENPETGEHEFVCSSKDFKPHNLADYWTANSLRGNWESVNGAIPDGYCLAPVTPFSLGGEFDISNLMCIPLPEAISLYSKIKREIADLHDGEQIKLSVKTSKRSQRRHDSSRLKNKRKNYKTHTAASALDTPALCSCHMCCNPRKFFNLETIQEKSGKELFGLDMKNL